jgi:hypothetical protein
MRPFVALLALGLLALASAACEQVTAETVTRTNSVTVPSTYRLEIDAFNGDVEIVPGEGNTLEIVATVRQPKDVEYAVTVDGETVHIMAVALRTRIDPSPGVSLQITAPPNADLNINSSNGSITLVGVGTGGLLETSNGTIRLEEVHGRFEVHSSNGSIEFDRVSGSFDASTSNGRIEFDGDLEDGTSSELRTSNGGIDVFIGGEANVRIDAETSNGEVDIVYPLDEAIVSEEHVEGTMGTGASTLILRTSNGDINIR